MTEQNADGQEVSVRYADGKLVINEEVAIDVYLHDPKGEPTPLADAEYLEIRHPADAMIDGYPSGIYSPEGRPDDQPRVTVQLESYGGDSDD